MVLISRLQQDAAIDHALCVMILCSFQTWHSFAKNSGPAVLVGLEPFTIVSTENDKADLLRVLYVLTQDWLVLHRAAELAGDQDQSRFVPWS